MKPFTKIAAVMLGLIAFMHLIRLITHWNVIINNFEIPVWASGLGCIIASALSLGLWREAKK